MLRLLLTLALVATSAGALVAADAAKTAAPKIAVLRLDEVLKKFKSYQTGSEKLSKRDADDKAALTLLDEQIKRIEGQLQVLKPDSANYGQYIEDLQVLKVKREVAEKRSNAELQRMQVSLMKDIYRQMRQSLAAFCQERGIMRVDLTTDGELNPTANVPLWLDIQLRPVLYADPSLDVTESFIQYLNASNLSAAGTDPADGKQLAVPTAPAPAAAPDAKPAP